MCETIGASCSLGLPGWRGKRRSDFFIKADAAVYLVFAKTCRSDCSDKTLETYFGKMNTWLSNQQVVIDVKSKVIYTLYLAQVSYEGEISIFEL